MANGSAGENRDSGATPALAASAAADANDTPDGEDKPHWIRPGVVGSLVLHAAIIFLLVYRAGEAPPQMPPSIVPVDVVELDEETTSPPPLQNIAAPKQMAAAPLKKAQQFASRELSIPRPPDGVAPSKTKPPLDELQLPPRDDLQTQLEALAKLRQPETSSPAKDRSGASDQSQNGSGGLAGPRAVYSVKDFVRAQIERRWSLDLDALGARNFTISIQVVLTRDGTIRKAEIVDKQRFNSDKVYHSIALSARNAVLLSSPVALPAGSYDEVMNMTLNLNPRDALQ
jgi:hypothetical protein